MSWAFSLFIVGIIITVTVQTFLRQCSRLEDYRKWPGNPFLRFILSDYYISPPSPAFSTQRLWGVLLGVFIYSSCLAVVAAICLLLLTVLKLHFNGSQDDAPLTFEVSPSPAAILALCTIGIGMFLGLMVLGIFVLANGANALLWQRRILRNRENDKRKRLDELM
jgi:hypothetical protein